jgi:excisionase family DNA binding protein
MRAELEPILASARQLSPAELPRLLGDLEEIRSTALARLTSPAAPVQPPDALLDVEEAAARLGTSRSYLYRNASRFPFTRRMGRSLRFSANGIEQYIRHKSVFTPKRQTAILSSVR